MRKFVYFVRHGQSEGNVKHVFQSAGDPLTNEGREQAHTVAARIRLSVKADVIITSPMIRALETARIIEELVHWPLVEEQVFREYLPPSSLVGESVRSERGLVYREGMKKNWQNPYWHFENEDNYLDLHERAKNAMQYLLDRPEENLLVVTHGGFMRTIITAMMTEGEPDALTAARFARFLKPLNTGITVCRYKDDGEIRNKWRLVSWNDHAHLIEPSVEEQI